MGVTIEKNFSKKIEAKDIIINVNAKMKVKLSYGVCINGDNAEYEISLGDAAIDASAYNQNVFDKKGTLFNANGAYNIKTGQYDYKVNSLTSENEINSITKRKAESTKDDFFAKVDKFGVYLQVNLISAKNTLADFGNLVQSYFEAIYNDYFNRDSEGNFDPDYNKTKD
jgi:hypothetical protein